MDCFWEIRLLLKLAAFSHIKPLISSGYLLLSICNIYSLKSITSPNSKLPMPIQELCISCLTIVVCFCFSINIYSRCQISCRKGYFRLPHVFFFLHPWWITFQTHYNHKNHCTFVAPGLWWGNFIVFCTRRMIWRSF